MTRLVRFIGVIGIVWLGTQVLSPCALSAQSVPQQAPQVFGEEPEECFLSDNYIDCKPRTM